MMWLFLLLFVMAPLIELYFLIQVGSVIGALPTILLSILTAVIGGYLVRMQGLAVLMRVRSTMDRGETPALELLDGAVLLLCGFALMLPGFITDTVGFALLVPALRQALIRRYVRTVPVESEMILRQQEARRRTIEGDWRRDD
ncbi:FxsA family protein [Halochromatium salexigens]|uniref:Exlusion protein FxsA n=1 Tax=Halochromatium salexigens TaxID=49447 RepID=A0AAJ0XEZ6_HALSE|nr:FxsA family protein [Halochromatium salexigens]MBK5929102.1 exlusion protein FxsA [Halochromatium salexigens]